MTTAFGKAGLTWVGLVLRGVYLGVATALLFSAVDSYPRVPEHLQHHVAEALVWEMIILTFPAGLLLTAVMIAGLAQLAFFTGIILPGGVWEIIVNWVLFTATGYLQWFGFRKILWWARGHHPESEGRGQSGVAP